MRTLLILGLVLTLVGCTELPNPLTILPAQVGSPAPSVHLATAFRNAASSRITTIDGILYDPATTNGRLFLEGQLYEAKTLEDRIILRDGTYYITRTVVIF